MRTCNMFDLDMTVDISVDYHYDPYDKIIELTSVKWGDVEICLLYTSPSPRDGLLSRMPSSA